MEVSVATRGILFLFCVAFQLSIPLIPRRLDNYLPLHFVVTWHEVIDLCLTPIVCVCSLWLFFGLVKGRKNLCLWLILFVIGLSIGCDGHGLHLASNRIHSYISPGNEWNSNGNELQHTVYFLDEYIGHSMAFYGWIIIFILMILADETRKVDATTSYLELLVLFILSSIQGIGWFMAAVEGQFAIPGMTICLLGTMNLLFRSAPTKHPISFCFHFASFVCLTLLILWGYYYSWTWPEFRVLGLGTFSTWPGQFLNYFQNNVLKR